MKKGLGKGLSALVEENLINPPAVSLNPEVHYFENKGILTVDVSKVLPSRYQPRKEFDEAFLEELAESIRKHGVIQPLVVSDLGDGNYELIAGERRLRASKLAELQSVPVVIREFEEKDRLAVALIENIQRADLNAIEIAEAYKEMIDRLSLTQDDVAKLVGKSRTGVANTLRLLKLPNNVRQMIINNNISEGHARALLALNDFTMIQETAILVEQEELSVRETEELVRKMLNKTETLPKESKPLSKDDRITALEQKLIRTLGIDTKISGNIQKGSVQFFYHTPQDLEILTKVLFQQSENN
ncbi:MAG: ParB/RepB/Spo0J family partition protein [Brevinemataceae bacterium]